MDTTGIEITESIFLRKSILSSMNAFIIEINKTYLTDVDVSSMMN